MIPLISFPFGNVSLFWSIQLLAFFITFFQSKDFLEIFFKGRFASWAVLSHFFYPARPRTNWVGNSTLPYLSVEGHYHCCKCSLSVLPIHISIQTHGHIVMSRDFFFASYAVYTVYIRYKVIAAWLLRHTFENFLFIWTVFSCAEAALE